MSSTPRNELCDPVINFYGATTSLFLCSISPHYDFNFLNISPLFLRGIQVPQYYIIPIIP
uniref:Uncharacterized protein n=1 Tax=Rhizophora mucronata TaxID=61149 RepID=A0A2P2NL60_RHIMU